MTMSVVSLFTFNIQGAQLPKDEHAGDSRAINVETPQSGTGN
jgi:hypothetical protein